MFSISGRAFWVLFILAIPLAQAQFVSSLPQCVQNCINQSQDDNCEVSDIGCLCRASAGNFLPDLITCMHGECDNSLDNNLLLTPLQLACQIAGAPIPASALRNAENQASSLAAQVTTTVTLGGSSATGGSEATTTVSMIALSVLTETVTKTESGSTIYLIYPITVGSTTTVSGAPSRVTSVSTTADHPSSYTGLIPVIIVTTNDKGSTYTTTTTEPGAISTYTTTDSRGRTVTQKSTYTKTTSAYSDNTSVSSTTTFTTSVQAAETSSTGTAGSKTSSASNPDSTNSSPFTDTNSSAAARENGRNWLGLGILLAVFCLWF